LVLSLTKDIILTEPITIPSGTTLRLNLNNYAIDFKYSSSGESRYAAFTVPTGAKLILMGGEIRGTDKDGSEQGYGQIKSVGVECDGGEAAISNVAITNVNTAVLVNDWASDKDNPGDSYVRITACNFNTSSSAIALWGNGTKTEAQTRMIIQDTTILSGYIGISGQGTANENAQYWGTELTLVNSDVEGYWAGIYQPQQLSTSAIVGCNITGNTGIVAKGGTVTVYRSTVIGTGKYALEKAGSSDTNQFARTGDGIYVEAVFDWRVNVVVSGSDNTVTGNSKAYAVDLFGEEGKGPGSITVDGSVVTSSHSNDIGTLTIKELTDDEKASLSGVTIPSA
jgi:hypothetical protein